MFKNLKFFILFIVMTNSFFSFSQDKIETEEWIIKIYNEYEREFNSEFDLIFENNFLVYTYFNSNFRVKVSDITKIEIINERVNKSDNEGWSSIYIYFNKGKLQTKEKKESKYITSENGNNIKILLSSNFITDGYTERIQKALIHLVKLNGGKAVIKKEPF
jgi:hypothetical protein